MPFDYLHANNNKAFVKRLEPRFEEMHRREIRQKARLLFNLNYPVERTINRIRQNMMWEFELEAYLPECFNHIEAIVTDIYNKTSKPSRGSDDMPRLPGRNEPFFTMPE